MVLRAVAHYAPVVSDLLLVVLKYRGPRVLIVRSSKTQARADESDELGPAGQLLDGDHVPLDLVSRWRENLRFFFYLRPSPLLLLQARRSRAAPPARTIRSGNVLNDW